MSSKTVFITGVSGFLGTYAAREFQARGWRVAGVDVTDSGPDGVAYAKLSLPGAGLDALLKNLRPDACLHCAGRASVALSMSEPNVDFRDGPALTMEVLDALRRNAPECKTVLLSSAAVYGNPTSLPVSEAHSPAPMSPYGWHKLQCEMLADELNRFFGLPTCAVRIFSAYGKGLRRQVVWDICQRALREGSLKLRGTGRESRDFIHAADVARAIYAIVENGDFEAERYNLASGVELSIHQLAIDLLRHLDLRIEPEFDGADTPGDPKNWRADISRVTALGYVQGVPLEDGLKEVASWARAELG